MTRTRLGLLGICFMLFGLMAFGAGSAQAAGEWLLAKPDGTLVPFLTVKIQLKKDKDASGNGIPLVLHTEIIKIKVLFKCTTPELVGAELIAGGSLKKGAKVHLGGCITELNEKASGACVPTDKEGGAGTIRMAASYGLIELVTLGDGTKHHIVKILPNEGTTFATFEMSKECAIGSKVPIIGKLVLKDCKGLFLTHLVEHLVEVGSEAEGTKLFAISETNEHKALILGSAIAYLIGEHEGWKFGGDTP